MHELPPETSEELSSVEADAMAEKALEGPDTFLEKPIEIPQVEEPDRSNTTNATNTTHEPVAAPPVQKDEMTLRVEKILEEGLGDYFATMPDDAKKRFHDKGDVVAVEIAGLVQRFGAKAKKVLQLIHDWLLTIPGVNKFFLEQEAKIKTDQILELQTALREEKNPHP